MKPENQNSNVFIEQMSRLFGGLSHKAPEKTVPAAPRMTCTRLRRFRITRQDLAVEPSLSPLTRTQDVSEVLNDRKESFAEWVMRNQEANPQPDGNEDPYNLEFKKSQTDDADKTIQAFTHFSSAALQQVARDPNTPVITLKWLAAHYDVAVRRALSTNDNLDANILHILARDEDSVKLTVLDNKNLSEEEILRLCGDNERAIAGKAKYILEQRFKPQNNHRRAMAATANIDLSSIKSIRPTRR